MLGEEWKTYDVERLVVLEGLLTQEELQIFAWAAENLYTGSGEIVDAGAFLGSSAAAFAHGLAANQRVQETSGRIHSFDLFSYMPFFRSEIRLLEGFERGQSFLSGFHTQLGRLDASVTVYPGDITRRTWRAGSIEILMLDCSKTEALNDHCLRQFLPSLVEGGYLFQQDYASASRLWWIHATTYLLREHLEFIGGVDSGGTMVFRCVKPITLSDVEAALSVQHASDPVEMGQAVAAGMRPVSRRAARAARRAAERYAADPF